MGRFSDVIILSLREEGTGAVLDDGMVEDKVRNVVGSAGWSVKGDMQGR